MSGAVVSIAAAASTRPGLVARPAPLKISLLVPGEDSLWDDYVRRHPDGSFFHLTGWRNAVTDTFRHRAFYLLARRGGRVTGCLPTFLVRSRLAGRLLVSIPYATSGGILADGHEELLALLAAAQEVCRDQRCRCLDLRSERAMIPDLPVVDRYVGFKRELPDRAEQVLESLPRKARAAARNGRDKFHLAVEVDDRRLKDVWRLYTASMHRLGSLAYPYSFFHRLIDASPGQHWVSLVRWEGRPVAGLVTFLFQDRAMPYFVGLADSARRCHAANFLYLHAMEHTVEHGMRIFDFGRSRRDNAGSCDFKRFHGFEPRPLGYQYYCPPGQSPPSISPTDRRYAIGRSLWRRLPLAATQFLGARLARHLPG